MSCSSRHGLDQIFVQSQGTANGASDGCDLHGVRQSGAMVVAHTASKHLCLAAEPSEGGRRAEFGRGLAETGLDTCAPPHGVRGRRSQR